MEFFGYWILTLKFAILVSVRNCPDFSNSANGHFKYNFSLSFAYLPKKDEICVAFKTELY